jgi:trehalose-6-phosphatase
LAIGDDITDEDLFKILPAPAITIHVGIGSTLAQYNLRTCAEVADLLQSLAAQ